VFHPCWIFRSENFFTRICKYAYGIFRRVVHFQQGFESYRFLAVGWVEQRGIRGHIPNRQSRAVASLGPGGEAAPEKYFAFPLLDEIRPLAFKVVIKKGKILKTKS